jgi:hypothetical protein
MADAWDQFPDAPGVATAPAKMAFDPWGQFPDAGPGQAPAPTEDYYNKFALGGGGAQPTNGDGSRSVTLTHHASSLPPVALAGDAIPRTLTQPEQLAADADTQVAQEAKDHPYGHAADDFILNLIRGTPIGSWSDEASAGMSAAANAVTGGLLGQPYDQAKAYEDARVRALDANSKTLGNIPTPLGKLPVTTGGLTKIAGGLLSAPLTPALKIWKGAALLPTMGNAAATGAMYGGIYGAGDDDGQGRLANAWNGAKLGAGIGAVVPPLARGVGNVASKAVQFAQPIPQALKDFSKQAIERVAPAFDADAVRTPNGFPASRSFGPQHGPTGVAPPLGPEGMLLDYGPNLKAVGAGLVHSNGPQRGIAVNALEARKAMVKPRITQEADAALGNPIDLPEYTDQAERAAQARANPLYAQFKKTPIKISENLHGILDRANAVFTPQEGGLFPAVQQIMKQEGINPNAAGNNGQMIDLIKQALDSKVQTALRAGDKQTAGRIGRIVADLRNETDAILRSHGHVARDAQGNIIRDPKTGLPKSIYQHARDTRGEDFKAAEAVEYGGDIFEKNLSADQVRFDMKRMSPEQREHVKTGAREKIRMIMSSNATKFGDNGDSAVMSALGSDEARAKLTLIVGPARANALINRLKAESTFEKTRMPLVEGSQTGLNTDARKLFPTAPKDAASKHNITMEGMAFGPVMKIADMLTHGAITEKNIRTATDAAKMMVAQGAQRDAIARGLRAYLNNKGLSNSARVAITRVANTIAYSSRGAAIDAQSRQKQLSAPRGIPSGR